MCHLKALDCGVRGHRFESHQLHLGRVFLQVFWFPSPGEASNLFPANPAHLGKMFLKRKKNPEKNKTKKPPTKQDQDQTPYCEIFPDESKGYLNCRCLNLGQFFTSSFVEVHLLVAPAAHDNRSISLSLSSEWRDQ